MNKHVHSKDCYFHGINLHEPATPKQLRDAIVECLIEDHSAQLEDLKNYVGEELENRKKMFGDLMKADMVTLLEKLFEEVGGNFNDPTPEALLMLSEKLFAYASHFPNKDIIQKHIPHFEAYIKKLKEYQASLEK